MHTVAHVVWGVSKHLAFGYLVYSVVQHSLGRAPTGRTASVLLAGTVFPDVADRVLMLAGVVGYGRTATHSLISACVITVAVVLLARRLDRVDVGYAFVVGYLSHAPVDTYGTLLTGSQPMDTAFLFWPVVVEYSLGVPTPELPVSRQSVFAVVMAGAFCLWLYDGAPVASDITRFSRSRLEARSESHR
ncbi:MAG: metal-dependent hydrolase [Halapricum sp.]